MKISYDYSDFLSELKEELELGVLTPDSEVQILRSENTLFDDYRVVVDWYYNDDTMEELLNEDDFEDINDIKEVYQLKKRYTADKPNLTTVKLKDLLEELEDVDSIL